MLKPVIAEAQQTQHAFQQSIMAENAKFQQNVASMLGKLWEDAHRAVRWCAIYTKPGLEREETSGDLGGEYRFSHSESAARRRRADSATDRFTGSTAASPATVGDLRLALGVKHPHDVIDQMDLDLAMSGVFRAVPLLPDSEKLGRIQVFTDGSAMLERAWPHRRTLAAWGAVLVQTNSQGLDALIGFLGETVQTQQHPQILGARVKTISTAELSAIIATFATCSACLQQASGVGFPFGQCVLYQGVAKAVSSKLQCGAHPVRESASGSNTSHHAGDVSTCQSAQWSVVQ